MLERVRGGESFLASVALGALFRGEESELATVGGMFLADAINVFLTLHAKR